VGQQFLKRHITKILFLIGSFGLPLYKAPIKADQYPLLINTHHSRFGIHSTWKDNTLMLRLHRGGPLIELGAVEAKTRGLKDNDWVEAWNDHGRVIARLKIRPGEPAGRVSMCHTPELYQDLIEGSSQSVLPIRITPTSLVGDYYHLKFKPNYYGPGGINRDVRVEVKRYLGAVPM
jgi:nitrate reductase / nitrite oxidoreductase, alpha subunit